jgi:predicted deacetylase
VETLTFAIRDDDTSFFTRPEDLTRVYGGIWDEAPVSLSVVPFQGRTKTKAIPPGYWTAGTELYPIGDNRELVAFLREQKTRGRISIMLHGYSHVDGPDGYEFESQSDLERKVREGKRYLEQIFDTSVRAFVPPHNRLSLNGYLAVTNAGLDIVQIVHFFAARPFTARYLPHLARLLWAKRIWKQRYPYVLDFGTHCEVAHHSLTPSVSFETLAKDLEFCHRRRGVFVVATHYWEADQVTRDGLKLRLALERLIRRGRELGARFCTVDEALMRK